MVALPIKEKKASFGIRPGITQSLKAPVLANQRKTSSQSLGQRIYGLDGRRNWHKPFGQALANELYVRRLSRNQFAGLL